MKQQSKLRLAKFFADPLEQSKLLKELRRGAPIEEALSMRRLPINAGKQLLRIKRGSDVDAAERAGLLEARKADSRLKDWAARHRQEIGDAENAAGRA